VTEVALFFLPFAIPEHASLVRPTLRARLRVDKQNGHWPPARQSDIDGSMRAESAAISVNGLTKTYRDVTAVDGIDFSVQRGAIVGLLGGNGAGKTTTIAMIMGLVTPSGGTARVLGVDMAHDRHRVLHRINFESPYVEMPMRLTVRQNLKIFGMLYGMPDLRARIAELAAELDLTTLLDRPSGKLSSGQKTRVALAKSLINRPDVLLLDEPTASLDPDTADWVRSHLERYRREHHAAILLASHNMPEVERLCDNVLMMKAGKIVDQGTPAELISRYGRQTMEDVFLDVARGRRSGEREAAE
jgi:ABC-2 type transport system ATP-binding protein